MCSRVGQFSNLCIVLLTGCVHKVALIWLKIKVYNFITNHKNKSPNHPIANNNMYIYSEYLIFSLRRNKTIHDSVLLRLPLPKLLHNVYILCTTQKGRHFWQEKSWMCQRHFPNNFAFRDGIKSCAWKLSRDLFHKLVKVWAQENIYIYNDPWL